MLMAEVKDVIRNHRIKKGITQDELGNIIGLAIATCQRVSEWERGVRVPSCKYILRIIAALDIPLDEFDDYTQIKKPGD